MRKVRSEDRWRGSEEEQDWESMRSSSHAQACTTRGSLCIGGEQGPGMWDLGREREGKVRERGKESREEQGVMEKEVTQ
eukprot:2870430-Rhodomonas_salina.1